MFSDPTALPFPKYVKGSRHRVALVSGTVLWRVAHVITHIGSLQLSDTVVWTYHNVSTHREWAFGLPALWLSVKRP